jgi:rhodanese-related sulfurtransferase
VIPQASLADAESARALRRATVLDVRTHDEFSAGHIADATFLPLHVVPLRLSELSRSESYLVVCESGARSAQATSYLLQQGYDARSVTGGMAAWRASGRPVQSGAPQGVRV